MKYFHNSKVEVRPQPLHFWFIVWILLPILVLLGVSTAAEAPMQNGMQFMTYPMQAPTALQPLTAPPFVNPPPTSPMIHKHITTTIFWVGEAADSSNGYIANAASAWDETWVQHYGGIDDPALRTGWRPAMFTPKENAFYAALPYSDISDSGDRKATASDCPLSPSLKSQPYSWCKNSWIAVSHNGKTAYAQWEDTGPFEEDDAAYVFGPAQPMNTNGAAAGLDVSPAVRDYLGLHDISSCDWKFTSFSRIPDGPWNQTVTASPGTRVN